MTEKGKWYLVRNPNGGLSELGLVQLSNELKLADLEGKPLKQQVVLIFEQRLNDVKAAQQKLAAEQALLEYAVEPGLHAPRQLKFATEVAR